MSESEFALNSERVSATQELDTNDYQEIGEEERRRTLDNLFVRCEYVDGLLGVRLLLALSKRCRNNGGGRRHNLGRLERTNERRKPFGEDIQRHTTRAAPRPRGTKERFTP